MNTLLPLLNPAGNLTVEKAMEIANVLQPDYIAKGIATSRAVIIIKLLQSYEALLQKKLSKEMFVCEVEEPQWKDYIGIGRKMGASVQTSDEAIFHCDYKAYELAQSKVIFEGFRSPDILEVAFDVEFINEKMGINFGELACNLSIGLTFYEEIETIGDLFTEIERYNRTATSKINLQFTENVLKELGL